MASRTYRSTDNPDLLIFISVDQDYTLIRSFNKKKQPVNLTSCFNVYYKNVTKISEQSTDNLIPIYHKIINN